VAVFAMSAVVASAASAALPEYQICKEEAGGKGEWKTKGECEKPGAVETSGKWKRFPATGVKFTSTGTVAKFKTAETEVECKKSKGKEGEITGSKTTGKLIITFEECKENKHSIPCSNITTSKLKGELFYINESKKEVGVTLTPEGTTQFAEFNCFFEKIKVFGCSAGSITPSDSQVTEFALKFEVTHPTGCAALEAEHGGKREAATETAEGKVINATAVEILTS